ncbi:MAG: Nif3-like dinuclear metal center hexameric protein [Candidatus Makana argininalis]
MLNIELENLVNKKLFNKLIKDYCPNGLQIEGRKKIKKIITGVTSCKTLIEIAIEKNADAIIVHHGYFWNNENIKIFGMKRKHFKKILTNNINLYVWHLPLDYNIKFGNNIQLANILKLNKINFISPLVLQGQFNKFLYVKELKKKLQFYLNNNIFYYGKTGSNFIKTVALCSGGGHKLIDIILNKKIDAFITGDKSEQCVNFAKENKLHLYTCGHYATEKFGIKSLGEWLFKKYNFDVSFIDIPNPA